MKNKEPSLGRIYNPDARVVKGKEEKCLPCLVHQDVLSPEEKKMLHTLLSNLLKKGNVHEAFGPSMSDTIVAHLKKNKITPSWNAQHSGTISIRLEEYIKVLSKFIEALGREI